MNRHVLGVVIGVLCIGSFGASVGQSLTSGQNQQAQARLKAVGLDPGSIDGMMGSQTEAALRIYQQQRGLPVSGQLDPASFQALFAASAGPEAVQEAQTPRAAPQDRPEQQRSAHDRSDRFQATQAQPSSPAFADQPDEGKVLGFDFFRDPLNAKQPMQTFDDVMQADVQAKPGVMAAQQQLLERRYNLTPRADPDYRMSRGKRSARPISFPIRRCPTRSKPPAVRCSPRCNS